jgi:hypothetical protein
MFLRIFPDSLAQPRPLPPPIVTLHLRAQDFGNVVVVSFEIAQANRTPRRTLVLHRGPRGWRVVHIHGSSLATTGG